MKLWVAALFVSVLALLGGTAAPSAQAAAPWKSAVVSGSFVDALTGKPLVGMKISLFVGIEGGGLHTDRTDAQGRFRLTVTEAKRFETFGVDIQLDDGDATTQQVEATIRRGANVNMGTLLWQTNGSVTVRAGSLGATVGKAWSADLINAKGVSVASCYIIHGTSCHMSYANPGRYAVRLQLDYGWGYVGNTALFEKSRRVVISSGKPTTYVVDARRATGSIAGVLDPAGSPAKSTARVFAQRVKGSELDSVGVYDRGSFVIKGLPAGEYTLRSRLDYTRGVHLVGTSTFSKTGKAATIQVNRGSRTHLGTLRLAAKYFQLGWA